MRYQVVHHSWVEVAAAGGHAQALQGSQTHGGVHGDAAADGCHAAAGAWWGGEGTVCQSVSLEAECQSALVLYALVLHKETNAHGVTVCIMVNNRGTARKLTAPTSFLHSWYITEVTGYEVDLVNGLAKHGSGLLHKVKVANAMKTVAADAMVLCQLGRYGVCVCSRGHRLMECSVKDGHLYGALWFAEMQMGDTAVLLLMWPLMMMMMVMVVMMVVMMMMYHK